jgi:hypothetical protein
VTGHTKLSRPSASPRFFSLRTQLVPAFADNSHMQGKTARGRRLLWCAPVLVVPLAWLGLRHSAISSGTAGMREPPGESGSTARGPERVRARERLHAVEALVAERNAESHREDEALVRADWRMVTTTPPHARLVALDPTLLRKHEHELRVQIASTLPTPGMAPNLARIAAEAHEAITRTDAVEALGRLGGGQAQRELLNLVDKLRPDDEARRQIMPLLRPRSLDDDETPKLAALLDSPTLALQEKQQIAFTLALVGLRDGMKLPATVKISPEGQKLIDSMTWLARRDSTGP